MLRHVLSVTFLAVLVLAGCSDDEPKQGGGGAAGHAGSGGSAGEGGTGTGGDAGAGGTGGEAGGGGAGGVGGVAGTAGAGGDGGHGGGGGEGGQGGQGGDPSSIVEGRLLYGSDYDKGMQGSIAFLNGDPANAVITDAEGRFRFSGVVPPYDLTIIDPSPWASTLVELKGLRRLNPVLSREIPLDPMRWANVTGAIGGVGYPLPTKSEIHVGLARAQSLIHLRTQGDVKEFGTFGWKGEPSYSGSLVGVLTGNRPGGGLEFRKAGTINPFDVEEGETKAVDLILDQDIETVTTTVSADPGAYSSHSQTAVASFDVLGVTFLGRLHQDIATLTLPDLVPLPVEGARIALMGATEDWRASAMVIADAVLNGETNLELPSEVVLETLAPALDEEVATNIPRLEWSSVPEALGYLVEVHHQGWIAKWFLPPDVSHLDLPDYGADLFKPSRGARVRWEVTAQMTPGHSPDELTEPHGPGTPPGWTVSPSFKALSYFSIAP